MLAKQLRTGRINIESFSLALLSFAFFGATYGVWLVLLADAQNALSLSPGALGGALAVGLLAALPVMLVTGRLINRWGVRVILAYAALLMGASWIGIALVEQYWVFVAFLVVYYASTGAFEVGMNAAGIQVEQESNVRIVSYFHATLSGCAAAAALAAGLLLVHGLSYQVLYVGIAVIALLFTLATNFRRKAPQRQRTETPGPSAVNLPNLYRTPAVLLLAFIVALGLMAEGELGNWAGIYLRSSLELSPLLGAAGVAVLHAAMLLGRLGVARAVLHHSRRDILLVAGAVASSGMALALVTQFVPVILVGFLATGLAISVVAPVTFSLAGDAAPDRVGEASSVLTTMGYTGLLLGPVIVGGLAEFIGLRLALASIIIVGGMISLLAYFVLRGSAAVLGGVMSRREAAVEL